MPPSHDDIKAGDFSSSGRAWSQPDGQFVAVYQRPSITFSAIPPWLSLPDELENGGPAEAARTSWLVN
jgi:hypothetical protein